MRGRDWSSPALVGSSTSRESKSPRCDPFPQLLHLPVRNVPPSLCRTIYLHRHPQYSAAPCRTRPSRRTQYGKQVGEVSGETTNSNAQGGRFCMGVGRRRVKITHVGANSYHAAWPDSTMHSVSRTTTRASACLPTSALYFIELKMSLTAAPRR